MSPSADRHQPWSELSTLIDSGEPALVTIPGTPNCHIFVDARGHRIGFRAPFAGEAPLSPLSQVAIRSTAFGGGLMLEITASDKRLFREFYSFICSIADRIQLESMGVTTAVEDALRGWHRLLREATLLSEDRQLGLLGELWALCRVARVVGWQVALQAWHEDATEEHDFGLPTCDLEVKTTSMERRVHRISSLRQLVPTAGRELYVLSLQFTRGGAAAAPLSLSSVVAGIVDELGPSLTDVFLKRLEAAGWSRDHIGHYVPDWRMRSAPCVISVNTSFPRITPETIAAANPSLTSRIGSVSYDVDVTGLGFELGTPEFDALLPEEPNAE